MSVIFISVKLGSRAWLTPEKGLFTHSLVRLFIRCVFVGSSAAPVLRCSLELVTRPGAFISFPETVSTSRVPFAAQLGSPPSAKSTLEQVQRVLPRR